MAAPGRDIIVIGASAGGVEALKQLASGLPRDLPAAVFVVVHIAPSAPMLLPTIINRVGTLRAEYARDGEPVRPGRIYLAPPGQHLLVRADGVRLTRGPRENLHRPAVDPLFRSAALAFGPRVIGVILSGNLDDGTRGLSAVKRAGGLAVVQEPGDALYPSMPASALHNVAVDHRVPLAELAPLLLRLTAVPAEPSRPTSQGRMDLAENRMSEDREVGHEDELDRIGTRSRFTCPECHGTLWEVESGELVDYRCHVGHAYSPETLFTDQSRELEDSLWAAIRSFEENAMMAERIAEGPRGEGQEALQQRFRERAKTARQHARKLRQLVDAMPVTAEEEPA